MVDSNLHLMFMLTIYVNVILILHGKEVIIGHIIRYFCNINDVFRNTVEFRRSNCGTHSTVGWEPSVVTLRSHKGEVSSWKQKY